MKHDFDRTLDDVGNIVHLEHVNVRQPDQQLATLFYVSGLGLTRDPYLMVGVDNMWINIGRSQMHLPTGPAQRVRGTIGIVMPGVTELNHRLRAVASLLSHTNFGFVENEKYTEAICPWGNRFRCHATSPEWGSAELGITYVEFLVPSGSADRIARFYREMMNASVDVGLRSGAVTASVRTGRNQHLLFRETDESIQSYDGHHVQIYIANFSGPYHKLLERGLITRDRDPHEWRFCDIVDLDTSEVVFTLEHEVRSLKHPLYARPLVNRNPAQDNRHYIPGKDIFSGSF
jgi:hypothetical protein